MIDDKVRDTAEMVTVVMTRVSKDLVRLYNSESDKSKKKEID